MNELARGYSFVMYQAKAEATYTIPFPYLHTDDIRVFAGDQGDAVEQSFKWAGPTTIQLAGEVPLGILVTIRRFTRRDDNLAVISEGTALAAKDLNINSRQLLYVIQEQIDFGSYGGSGLPGGGSGWPNQGGSGNLAIQQIIDQLMQSPVMGLLVSRLDDIDDTAETMLEELLRSDDNFDERRSILGRIATAEENFRTVQDGYQSLAEQTVELFAKFDDSAAQFRQINQASATETEARASSETRYNAAIAENKAQVIEVHEALVNETEARASSGLQLTAKIDANKAQITSVSQSLVNETGARTTAISTARADFTAADAAVTAALNQTLTSTYATKNYAQAIAQTQVETFANGRFVNLQERFEALIDGNADPGTAGAWQANWTVRINAGAINGVPVIAGIGLGVDSKTGSNFIVMADRFGIVSPTYTSVGGVQQMKYPFVVGQVGGVSTVGITGQLIVDGSISADKITTNTLSAISANMGEVNGGTFRTYQLDAQGQIINPLEFRAEMTNKPSDLYPFWLGAGVKNWNNAVFAVDRDGNAKFAGTIEAQNMIGDLQRAVTGSWSGDLQANIGGQATPMTLPAPLRLGETHTPVINLAVTCSSTGAAVARGRIQVQRLDDAQWVIIRDMQYTLRNGNSSGFAILVTDTPTSIAKAYRVALVDAGSHGDEFHMYEVSGYIFGLR